MQRRFSDLPRTCRLYIIGICILAAVFFIYAILRFQFASYIHITSRELLFWAFAVILSESLVVYLPLTGCLSIGTAIDIPIILMFGPTLAAVYGILGALSSSLVIRKVPFYRLFFNVALFILTMGISSWVYQGLAQGINFVEAPQLIAVFLLTILVYFGLNSGLLSVVIALSEDLSPRTVWMKNHSWTIGYLFVLAAIGYLMVMVNYALGKWAIVVLLLPVLLTRKVYGQYMDLKKMQDQLIQSERLAAVGQMAAGISHEIDNPISVIMGYSDYLLKKTPSSDSRIEDIKVIRKEAERCKATTREFLDFSKPKVQVETISINLAIRNAISLLRHERVSRSIKIIFEEDHTLPDIKGDLKKLEQVFVNIMLNAFQAMPTGGSLRISTSVAENPHRHEKAFFSRIWSNESKDDVVKVEFEDTGCGITKENLKRVFTPFFTTRSQEGGRGLGLFVSHQIIQEHGGSFEIKSDSGRGTSVAVTLPFKQ